MKALFISFFIFISCGAFANSAYTPPTKITPREIPILYEDDLSNKSFPQMVWIAASAAITGNPLTKTLKAYPIRQLIHLQNEIDISNIVSDHFFLVYNFDPQNFTPGRTITFKKAFHIVIDLSMFYNEHSSINAEQLTAYIQNKYTDEEIDSLYLITNPAGNTRARVLLSSIEQTDINYYFIQSPFNNK